MRTLPSASVISSLDTFDSDTRSISVLSLGKSMGGSPASLKETRIYSKLRVLPSFRGNEGEILKTAAAFGTTAGVGRAPSGQAGPGAQVGLADPAHSTLAHAAIW